MVTINDYLDDVLDDFKKYVDSEEKLCDLRDVHFDGGKIPDYSNRHIQQLYLLRYAYAYAFEYKTMYQELLKRTKIADHIKVTSIGCGNMIDYWSLSRVVGKNCSICYRGIDAIDWDYKFPVRRRDDVEYLIGNVLNCFQSANSFSSDVYIFPKSISEFSLEEVYTLANFFTSENITKNVIHFMFSLRTDIGSIQRDAVKTSILFNHLLQCGFHTQDEKIYIVISTAQLVVRRFEKLTVIFTIQVMSLTIWTNYSSSVLNILSVKKVWNAKGG